MIQSLIEAFYNLGYFINGVWNAMMSNVLLCIPIVMAILYIALGVIQDIFKMLKKGG